MAQILVVDDEKMVRRAIAAVLRIQPWTVEEAANGSEALASARRSPPDLIVCDLNMPMMDGFEILMAVRADPDLSHIPFLLVSGRMGEDYERRALALGAQAFLLKPFNAESLLQLVHANLRGKV